MNIWSRLGISVSIVATFCIIMTEVFQSRSFYEIYKWYICAGFLAMGCVIWIVGRVLNARTSAKARQPDAAEGGEETENETNPDNAAPMLLNLCYWGPMVFVFGIIIIFIVPYKEQPSQTAAVRTNDVKKAVPAPTNVPPAEVKLQPKAPTPKVSPLLKLQGIVYRLPDPSALINGRTYFVGDQIEEARVVAIQENSATLAWGGQFHVLVLGQ
jgi:hypothetical protein